MRLSVQALNQWGMEVPSRIARPFDEKRQSSVQVNDLSLIDPSSADLLSSVNSSKIYQPVCSYFNDSEVSHRSITQELRGAADKGREVRVAEPRNGSEN
jgi:hypothetical protein